MDADIDMRGTDDGDRPSHGINSSTINYSSEITLSDTTVSRKTSARTRLRQRISRACDHCNSARRKCDGCEPCGYCLRTRSMCTYKRQLKKRGKLPASKNPVQYTERETSPLQDQRPVEASIASVPSQHSEPLGTEPLHTPYQEDYPQTEQVDLTPTNVAGVLSPSPFDIMLDDYQMFNDPSWSLPDFEEDMGPYIAGSPSVLTHPHEPLGPSEEHSELQETYGIHSFRSTKESLVSQTTDSSKLRRSRANFLNIRKSSLGPKLQRDAQDFEERQRETLLNTNPPPKENRNVEFPVLKDVLHLLRPFLPDTLSYDLLQAYFKVSTATTAYLAPCAPPSVYRKVSFLRVEEPRKSSQVLLVSMLWLSAQTADIPLLTASIARRKYVRRKLLELTTRLLKPLNEVSLGNDLALEDRLSSGHQIFNESGNNQMTKSRPSQDDNVDEIMAYVHLAMVTSASEFKGASLRWWNIAFCLAREAKLHQEIPDTPQATRDNSDYEDISVGSSKVVDYEHYIFASQISEERREERRRVFWFLYTMDRHLSLSYNKPLALLDSDCQSLRRPCDDQIWQSDQAFAPLLLLKTGQGPYFECQDPTFFGFFMPLQALLGEIVYFVGAQNHPRFGVSQRTLLDWKEWEQGIADRLDDYELSLQRLLSLEEANSATKGLHQDSKAESPSQPSKDSTHREQIPFQNQVAHAYAKIIIHVLHVLLAGKWDALALLEETNSWHSSPGFITTISHVVEAAKSAEVLLELDPDAHFMPFFLGIYLFQGSIPLVVAADHLETDAAEIVIKACSTMIKIHEAHISRMPSEYQISFVSVLRLALKKMQGRPAYDSVDPVKRQQQVFKRYSWAREGRGLAA